MRKFSRARFVSSGIGKHYFNKESAMHVEGTRTSECTGSCFISEDSIDVQPGWLLTRVRAISARVNKNFDGFTSQELKAAYKTFEGKPVFVNHVNHDVKRARGRVALANYHEHGSDKFIECFMLVDGNSYPKLAQEILDDNLDSVSMGCDIVSSICSLSSCRNEAKNAFQFCDHVLNHKGKKIGGELVYEECVGLSFFELSYVFDPADETAVMQEVRVASSEDENIFLSEDLLDTNPLRVSSGRSIVALAVDDVVSPKEVDTLRTEEVCPECGADDFDGKECDGCGYVPPIDELSEPDVDAVEKPDVKEEPKNEEEVEVDEKLKKALLARRAGNQKKATKLLPVHRKTSNLYEKAFWAGYNSNENTTPEDVFAELGIDINDPSTNLNKVEEIIDAFEAGFLTKNKNKMSRHAFSNWSEALCRNDNRIGRKKADRMDSVTNIGNWTLTDDIGDDPPVTGDLQDIADRLHQWFIAGTSGDAGLEKAMEDLLYKAHRGEPTHAEEEYLGVRLVRNSKRNSSANRSKVSGANTVEEMIVDLVHLSNWHDDSGYDGSVLSYIDFLGDDEDEFYAELVEEGMQSWSFTALVNGNIVAESDAVYGDEREAMLGLVDALRASSGLSAYFSKASSFNNSRKTAKTWYDVVFMDGDDYHQMIDEVGEDPDAMIAYMSQWDNGDLGQSRETSPAGSYDYVYTNDIGNGQSYELNHNPSMGYAGLSIVAKRSSRRSAKTYNWELSESDDGDPAWIKETDQYQLFVYANPSYGKYWWQAALNDLSNSSNGRADSVEEAKKAAEDALSTMTAKTSSYKRRQAGW